MHISTHQLFNMVASRGSFACISNDTYELRWQEFVVARVVQVQVLSGLGSSLHTGHLVVSHVDFLDNVGDQLHIKRHLLVDLLLLKLRLGTLLFTSGHLTILEVNWFTTTSGSATEVRWILDHSSCRFTLFRLAVGGRSRRSYLLLALSLIKQLLIGDVLVRSELGRLDWEIISACGLIRHDRETFHLLFEGVRSHRSS